MLKQYVSVKNILLLILAIWVLFLLIPCNNTGDKTNSTDVLEIEQRRISDSIIALMKDKEFQEKNEFLNGQIALKDNKVQAQQFQLDSFSKVVKALLRKRNVVKPDVDTTFTTVPNEYITDCNDCFNTLEVYNNRVEAATAEYNELNELYINQAATYDAQVKEVQSQRDTCNKRYNQLKAILTKPNEETWKIKLGISTMSINSILPNAFGPGVMYEDKNGNDFIGKMYLSKYGNVYAIDIFKTIHFKKRRR